MTRLVLAGDLHLGHHNICKYREGFESAEHHHETILQNVKEFVNKRDTLWLMGDVAFDKYWLGRINEIKCRRKVLICGNHDTERGLDIWDLVEVYDDVKSLVSHRKFWFSHAPIHPQEIRGRIGNIHAHLHQDVVNKHVGGKVFEKDPRYLNVSIDHHDLKPVTFSDLMKKHGLTELAR